MALLPERGNPTLLALDAALEARQELWTSQNIGFGEIGHECERYLYNKIHSKVPEVCSAQSLRLFRSGNISEDVMADDLRLIPGVELWTNDPERGGKQYKLDSLGGRFTGRMDGVILGLREAPSTPHVWEHKDAENDKFDKLLKLVDKFGEKHALKEWNFKYYCQAQSCMLHAELDRHFMTVSTPGLRRVTSLRTELDKPFAEALVLKAERIINATRPPEKIGGPDFWVCKNCRFYNDCHGGGQQ